MQALARGRRGRRTVRDLLLDRRRRARQRLLERLSAPSLSPTAARRSVNTTNASNSTTATAFSATASTLASNSGANDAGSGTAVVGAALVPPVGGVLQVRAIDFVQIVMFSRLLRGFVDVIAEE
jgi:hypothetical protein